MRILQSASCWILAVGLLLANGCGKPDPKDRYVRPDQITDFHRLFGKNCSGCHGMDGQLGPAPPLNDPLFQAIISDEQLAEVITNGRPSTLMPAFAKRQGGSLTKEQVAILVAGIRKQWATPPRSPAEQPPAYQVTASDPAGLADGNLEQGRTAFAAACASCHGDQGEGGIHGALDQHAFGGLISDQLLRRILITGRPDLGMPDYVACGQQSSLARPLRSEDLVDIAIYVRSLSAKPRIGAASKPSASSTHE